MPNLTISLPPAPRIVVVRALQLGDLLCAVPALRALRAAFPAAEITLIGLPWASSFVTRFARYLDGLLPFPGFPGLPEQTPRLGEIPDFFAAAQAMQFDLAIQLHGSGLLLNSLTALLGARCNAGYVLPGQYCPDPEHFLPYPEHEHEVRTHLCLLAFLGIPTCGEELEFPLYESDIAELAAIEGAAALQPGSYVCVHPGARYPSRRWLPERFAAVADALAANGLQIVLTGTAEERALVGAVAGAMRAPSLNLAGRTSLGGLAALLNRARLVVANDTGISHVAAALRAPSVIIASGSDVHRWAPLDRTLHRVVWQQIECRPCAHFDCPIGHPCATAVQVEDVLREARLLLAGIGDAALQPAPAAGGGPP